MSTLYTSVVTVKLQNGGTDFGPKLAILILKISTQSDKSLILTLFQLLALSLFNQLRLYLIIVLSIRVDIALDKGEPCGYALLILNVVPAEEADEHVLLVDDALGEELP